jgi:hypothetical protein
MTAARLHVAAMPSGDRVKWSGSLVDPPTKVAVWDTCLSRSSFWAAKNVGILTGLPPIVLAVALLSL